MKKRNNMFMLAYIVFIVLCVVFRFFVNFTLWRPIVLAVTISSIFFAFEDLFVSLSREYKSLHDVELNFIATAREQCEKDKKTVSRLSAKIEKYKGLSDNMDNVIAANDNTMVCIENTFKSIDNIEKEADDLLAKQDRYKTLSSIFAFVGFLTLFCVLVISSIVTVNDVFQEICTVFAFVIILITQYVNAVSPDRIARNAKLNEETLKEHDDIPPMLQETEKEIDELVESIEKVRKLEAELATYNADHECAIR